MTRILDTAEALIQGESTLKLTDLARALGVTRQTVYKYFPGVDAVQVALSVRSADGLLARVSAKLVGVTDPVEALVEGILIVLDEMADDPFARAVLERHGPSGHGASSSGTAIAFGRSLFGRSEVRWEDHGFRNQELDELAEFSMRVCLSLVTDPGHPPRGKAEMRRFITRWLGPAIIYPRLRNSVGSLSVRLTGQTPRRRPSAPGK